MTARLRIALAVIAVTALIAAFGGVASSTASAAPPTAPVVSATATANAATATLAGSGTLTTGSCTAAPLALTGPCGPVELTPSPGVLSVGLLVQQARASVIAFAGQPPLVATSSACAGAVGAGGTIQLGTGGSCLAATGRSSGGVVVDLGVATLRADAITAQCAASSAGPPTAQVELVNATIRGLDPLSPPITLTSTPGPNTTLSGLGPLVTLTLNAQAPSHAPGTIAATALDITVAASGVAPTVHVTIGTVSCGPDVVPAPVAPPTTLPAPPSTTIPVPLSSTTVPPPATTPSTPTTLLPRASDSIPGAVVPTAVVASLPVTG